MKRAIAGLFISLILGAPAARAQTENKIQLIIRPTAAPEPALKYRLLPELEDMEPGNAALIYYRAFSPEWFFFRRPEIRKKIEKWTENRRQAPDRRDPDLQSVMQSRALKEVDLAARREHCDWELLSRSRKEGAVLLVPDLQALREFGNLLALRARLETAEGRYDKTVYTLQTGFALARHVSEGTTLIHALVGVAIASSMAEQLEELIQAPGSPNFYWALTGLPRPLIDMRFGLQGEKLAELRLSESAPLSVAQQRDLQGRLSALLKTGMLASPEEMHMLMGPTFHMPLIGQVVQAYPEAKRALIAQGRKPADVEEMPALQVATIYWLQQYDRLRDDLFKWFMLPFPEGRAGLEQADGRIRQAKAHMEAGPFIEMLPGLQHAYLTKARTDRRIAALRCIEAIRLYAAGHDGKLPATLADMKEVPIPADPLTGKSFEYTVDGENATLYGPPPPVWRNEAINYQLTLKK